MADITKRAAKRLRGHLEPGEEVTVAVIVESKGTLGLAMVPLVAAPLTTTKIRDRRTAARHAETGGIAAGFPSGSCAIVVTDRRILVSPTNGITFKPPVLDLPLGHLRLVENRSRGIGRRIEFAFADTSTVQVDASRGQPFERLAQVLSQLSG